MSEQRRLFRVTYPKQEGGKEVRTSPYLTNAGGALVWLLRQKPYLTRHLTEIVIRPWQRGDQT